MGVRFIILQGLSGWLQALLVKLVPLAWPASCAGLCQLAFGTEPGGSFCFPCSLITTPAPEFCLLPNSKHLDLLLPESWRLQPTSRLLDLPSLNSLISLLSPTPNCCFGVRRHCNNSRISAEPLVLPPGIPFVSSNRGSLQPQNSQIR